MIASGSVDGALRLGAVDRLRQRIGQGELGPLPIVIGMAVIWIYFQIQNSNFLTPRNLTDLLLQMTITGTVAAGIVLVLLLGEIDLSVGSMVGLTSAILGVLLVQQQQPWWVAIGVALLVAAAIGAAQGAIAAYVGVPTFVVTLAGMLGLLGMQLWVLGTTGSINVADPSVTFLFTTYVPPILGWLGAVALVAGYTGQKIYSNKQRLRLRLDPESWSGLLARPALVALVVLISVGVLNEWHGVPLAAFVMLLLVAALDLLLTETSFGRHVFAVGGNPEAARRAGINVARIRIAIFSMCALMAGIAGFMSVSRSLAASTQTGSGTLLLEAIAAGVIGGTSLFGGRGSVWSAPLGALVMASLANGLDLTGEPPDIKYIVEMTVLLVAVTVDAVSRRSRANSGR
jgi:D-xylose transport system permease protein